MNKVFIEENNVYKFDFSNSMYALNTLNSIYHTSKIELSDVDFIVETTNYIYLIEFKNSNIPNAVAPNSFNPKSDTSFSKIARKYYDSLLYVRAIGKCKPCVYIYILEYPLGDSATRRLIRNRIHTKLPFLLQNRTEIQNQLIYKFDVLSIEEWNNHEEYSKFPILKL